MRYEISKTTNEIEDILQKSITPNHISPPVLPLSSSTEELATRSFSNLNTKVASLSNIGRFISYKRDVDHLVCDILLCGC